MLGVSPHADAAVVRAAYRVLSQIHHPDKAPADRKEVATRRMAEINEAYETLGDADLRRAYDDLRGASHGGTERPPQPPRARSTAAAFSRTAFWAVMATSVPVALAFSFERKTPLRIFWEFMSSGFVSPSSYEFHWGIFLFLMFIGWATARTAAHRVPARS